jgi:hypothetical protein
MIMPRPGQEKNMKVKTVGPKPQDFGREQRIEVFMCAVITGTIAGGSLDGNIIARNLREIVPECMDCYDELIEREDIE